MIEVSDIRSHEEMVAAFFAGGTPSDMKNGPEDPCLRRTREIDMTWGVLGRLNELWDLSDPHDWVAAEMPTASSIADLAVARFDPIALQARSTEAALAITLPLRVRTLDAIANRGISRLGTLAPRMGSNPKALTRSTIRPLIADGWIEADGDRVAMARAWQPVCSEIMTVEMKLTDWRGALAQARSQALSANRVWVVLPSKSGRVIASALPDFQANGIGLATLAADDTIQIHYAARRQSPIRWLSLLLAETMLAQYANRHSAATPADLD